MDVAIEGALAASILARAASGVMMTEFKGPPFNATLAMMSIARGLANMITNGARIIGFAPGFNKSAIIRYGGFLTMTVAVMFIVFIVTILVQRHREGGRALYANGGNPEAARLAGINVKRSTVPVYAATAFLSDLPGILMAARLDAVLPSSGVGHELDAVAAVVIGGNSLSGGTGSVGGTIIGVLIIGVRRNGLTLLGMSFLQAVIIGLPVPNLQAGFFNQIKLDVEGQAAKLGIEEIGVDAKNGTNTQVSQVQDLLTQGIDALIYIPAGAAAAAVPTRLARAEGIPVINVDREPDGEPGDPVINGEDVVSACQVCDHIIGLAGGEGQMIVVHGQKGIMPEVPRFEGRNMAINENPGVDLVAQQWRQ